MQIEKQATDITVAIAVTKATTDTKSAVLPKKRALHDRHTLFLFPMVLPGVTVVRPLSVFGYDDAPKGHAEVHFENVQIPGPGSDEIDSPMSDFFGCGVLGVLGRGFDHAQSRLGPGRLHHCCRLIGHAERALEMIVKRGFERQAFGKKLIDLGGNMEKLALARVALAQAKLVVLQAAVELDFHDELELSSSTTTSSTSTSTGSSGNNSSSGEKPSNTVARLKLSHSGNPPRLDHSL